MIIILTSHFISYKYFSKIYVVFVYVIYSICIYSFPVAIFPISSCLVVYCLLFKAIKLTSFCITLDVWEGTDEKEYPKKASTNSDSAKG